MPNVLARARAELLRSRHEVHFAATVAGERGKFENLNALLADHPAAGHDWLLVIDDDVVAAAAASWTCSCSSPSASTSRLAQPAHRRRSHAAWAVTRRRPASVARETAFVEIGPVFAFHARHLRHAAAVPAAAGRLGPGRSIGRRWRARRGWRDRGDRRHAGPPRPAPDRQLLRPRRRGRRGPAASSPGAPTRPPPRPSAPCARPPPLAMRVAGGRRVLPAGRRSRPWASGRTARRWPRARPAPMCACWSCTARCRPWPMPRRLRRAGDARRAAPARRADARRDRCPATCATSRRRGRGATPRWGAWAAPALRRALARLRRRVSVRPRPRALRGARRRRGAPRGAPRRRCWSRCTAATCTAPAMPRATVRRDARATRGSCWPTAPARLGVALQRGAGRTRVVHLGTDLPARIRATRRRRRRSSASAT